MAGLNSNVKRGALDIQTGGRRVGALPEPAHCAAPTKKHKSPLPVVQFLKAERSDRPPSLELIGDLRLISGC